MNYFETKVRHDEVAENGMTRKTTETFLVDAMSFTEAESRIISRMSQINGEFAVLTIRRVNYSDIVISDGKQPEKWYKCKVFFISLNEKTGKELKTGVYMLVGGNTPDEVSKSLSSYLSFSSDYEVSSITETLISDIIKIQDNEGIKTC